MRKPKKAMDDVSWIRIWELHDKIIRPDGSIYLCTLHRLCGPAVERDNGSKEWWVNGDRHRTNGPAMEEIGDPVRWYVSGKRMDEFSHAERIQGRIFRQERARSRIPRDPAHLVIYE